MNIIPVSPVNSNLYQEVGIHSYHQHYLHLWKDADPGPYIESNFRDEVIAHDLRNPNLAHFIIELNGTPAGIMKIVRDAALENFTEAEAILLEKIYLLEAYSGQGLGKLCLEFVIEYARQLHKKVLWLDTMKNGRALSFYLNFGFEIVGEKDLSYHSVHQAQKPMYILLYHLEQ